MMQDADDPHRIDLHPIEDAMAPMDKAAHFGTYPKIDRAALRILPKPFARRVKTGQIGIGDGKTELLDTEDGDFFQIGAGGRAVDQLSQGRAGGGP